ncbi:hypothetical protein C0995_000017 [Termitomyces sp. Mi166|nr:hypothetical protein C0995_000017 [Termitomyces sp. Mi166\
MSFKDNQARLVLNKKGTSYAILAASSDYVLSVDSISNSWAINGTVKLTLGDSQAIHSVVVSILGQIVTGANATKHITFLDITQTLWSKKKAENFPYNLPINRNRSQRLSGDHCWPFSITFPKEVRLPSRRNHVPEIFRLPESFNERNIRASVQYSIHLRLTRGKFRADDKLRIALTCPPVTWPGLIPVRSQSLYNTLSLLRGQLEDPEAWYTHRSVVSGRLDHCPINVKYTLLLAKPLIYARGSVIPFSLVIEASSEDVLDILSSSEAPVLRLRRCVKYDDGISSRFQPLTKREAIDYSDLAVWWPSSEYRTSNFRRLSGELQLPPDMKPTTTIAHFRIKYSVVLFPFDVVSFKSPSGEPLAIIDVEIA